MYLHHFLFHTYAKSGSKCGNQRTPAAKIQHLYIGEQVNEDARGGVAPDASVICSYARALADPDELAPIAISAARGNYYARVPSAAHTGEAFTYTR